MTDHLLRRPTTYFICYLPHPLTFIHLSIPHLSLSLSQVYGPDCALTVPAAFPSLDPRRVIPLGYVPSPGKQSSLRPPVAVFCSGQRL